MAVKMLDDDPLWYKDAIFYEVFVRSFPDSNGDGVIDAERPLTDSSTVLASQGFAFDGPDLLVSGRSRQGTGLHRVTAVLSDDPVLEDVLVGAFSRGRARPLDRHPCDLGGR